MLVVDDEKPVRNMIARMVTSGGEWECETAESAAEARTLLARRGFSLVICDVNMPGESGTELTSWIREHHPDVPVLMATGIDDPELAQSILALGAYGYLVISAAPTVGGRGTRTRTSSRCSPTRASRRSTGSAVSGSGPGHRAPRTHHARRTTWMRGSRRISRPGRRSRRALRGAGGVLSLVAAIDGRVVVVGTAGELNRYYTIDREALRRS